MRLVIECGETGVVLVVDGRALCVGDELDGRFGLDHHRVCERLVRIIVMLALRKLDEGDAFVDASELSATIDRGPDASGTGLAKFLARRLERHERALGRRSVALVEAEHASKGGYRLGVAATDIEFRYGSERLDARQRLDERGVPWSLVGPGSSALTMPHLELESALARSDALYRLGDLPAARHVVVVSLRLDEQLRGKSELLRLRPLHAIAHERIAYLDMEMGQSEAAQRGAERALQHYRALADAQGRARANQVRAHAQRQQRKFGEAVVSAQQSLASVKGRRARAGLQHAGFLGVLGQQLTYGGRPHEATEHLARALYIASEAGNARWTACWHLRLVENELALGRLAHAEFHLDRARALHGGLPRDNVPHDALLHRISANFLIAAGRIDEARLDIATAITIGEQHRMTFQLEAMKPLRKFIEGDDDALA